MAIGSLLGGLLGSSGSGGGSLLSSATSNLGNPNIKSKGLRAAANVFDFGGALSTLFGLKPKQAELNIPPPVRLENALPGGGDFLERLRRRASGLDLGGFPQGAFQQAKTALRGTAQEDVNRRQEAIANKFSGVGLGRSSISPARQMETQRLSDLDIQQKLANLRLSDLKAQQSTRQTSQGQFLSALTSAANQQSRIPTFQLAQAGLQGQLGQAADKTQSEGLLRLLQSGTGLIGGAMEKKPSTLDGTTESIIDDILRKRQAQQVNK